MQYLWVEIRIISFWLWASFLVYFISRSYRGRMGSMTLVIPSNIIIHNRCWVISSSNYFAAIHQSVLKCYYSNLLSFKRLAIPQSIEKHYLLQGKFMPPLQAPFHFLGTGPKPLSLKLLLSGQIPVSMMPTIISLSTLRFLVIDWLKPMKSQDLVVWSWSVLLGKTDTTSSMPACHSYKNKSHNSNIYIYKYKGKYCAILTGQLFSLMISEIGCKSTETPFVTSNQYIFYWAALTYWDWEKRV